MSKKQLIFKILAFVPPLTLLYFLVLYIMAHPENYITGVEVPLLGLCFSFFVAGAMIKEQVILYVLKNQECSEE